MAEEALFDPGFAPYVYSFTENVQAIDTIMRTLKSPNQRKFKYQILKPQIIALAANSAAFYLGCLMWAKHLKEDFENGCVEIVNNPFLGINLEDKNITKEDFCADIDNFISYFEKFEKDCKFYLGKSFQLPEGYRQIAKIYKEFLLINNSFVNTKYTSDINLPENIDLIINNSNQTNCTKIQQAIDEGKLELLLPLE